jgi:LytR cell envelope-related transcriptional attenuator
VEQAFFKTKPVETPWRTAAIVAAGVAAIELFILVLVAVVFGAKLITDHAENAVGAPIATKTSAPANATQTGTVSEPNTTKAAPAEPLPRRRTSVIVLNGNGLPGAAAVTADRVRRFHYLIAGTGNAPRSNFQHSVVMYRPGRRSEAVRLAHDLRIRRVAPLDGLTRKDLQGAHLAVIIGG